MSNISIYSTSRLVNWGHLFISTSCMSPLFQKEPRTSWLLPSLRYLETARALITSETSCGIGTFPLEDLLLSEKTNNFPRTLSASKSSFRQNPLERPAVACRWRRRRETFKLRARWTVAAVRTWLEGCFFFSLPQLACRLRSVIGNSCFVWECRALNIAEEKIFYKKNSPDRAAIGSICKRRLLPVHVSSYRSEQEIELSQCTAHWL